MSNNYKRIIQLCFGASLLLAVMAPQAIQTKNEKQANPAASWSQSQIESRIEELEAEHAQRLALLQASNPEAKQEAVSNSSNTLSQVLPNMLVLLGIATVPALLLLLWRMKKEQPVVVFDWERTVTLQPMPEFESSIIKIANHAAINRTTNQTTNSASGSRTASAHKVGAFPDSFDSIEYEVVRVSSVVEHNDGPESESVSLEGNDLIEQTAPLAQAKFWNALDKSDVAISILEGVVEQERTPQSWLFLLDLYAKTNQASSYEAMRLRFKNFFNGKVPPLE